MTVSLQSPDILEVTLRDGSYLVDFQFTAEDTATVAAALEAVGLRWIEVGHGLGLGASVSGHGVAAATDEEYMEAAAQALQEAHWGMFFIPGIGDIQDLRLAARYKMSFVRIGTSVTEVERARPFIAAAKDLGLMVSYNAMKSYAVSPADFGRCATMAHHWGADIVCLVDSAGGMYPDDVSAYLKAAQVQSDVRLGFHGHDNLSLAMANTLRAIECGAALVDSSLQGMGRSAGNAITEVLVAILKQRGLLPQLDLKAVMDVGQGLIQPLMRQRGLDPMAVTAGYARFHSSYTAKVQQYASKYKLDVRDLIVRLCQEDQITAPDALLEQLSQELAANRRHSIVSIPVFGFRKRKEAFTQEALVLLLKEIRPLAVKAGKFSTLNIVIGEEPQADILVSGNIQNTHLHMVGSLMLTTREQLLSVLRVADGAVDVVFLDVDRKPISLASPEQIARQQLHKSLLLTYSNNRVWVEAVEDQVVRLMQESLGDRSLVIAGDHPKTRRLALRCAERGASVTILTAPGSKLPPSFLETMSFFSVDPEPLKISYLNCDSPEAKDCLAQACLVVVWPQAKPWFGLEQAQRLATEAYVLDASIGAILPEGLEEVRRRGASLIRVNMWPAMAGSLLAAHEFAQVYQDSLGWGVLAEVPIVAGGAIGQRGDVVVDSVRQPTRVIGVADGHGGVLFNYDVEEAERVHRVTQEINRRLITPSIQNE